MSFCGIDRRFSDGMDLSLCGRGDGGDFGHYFCIFKLIYIFYLS